VSIDVKLRRYVLLYHLVWAPWLFAMRTVTLSPQATELVTQLGKRADIVAGSNISIPGSPPLNDIGPLFMPSIERMVRYAPDWVISDSFFTAPTFLQGVAALRVNTLQLEISDLSSLISESRRILNSIYGSPDNIEIDRATDCLGKLPKKSAAFRYLAFAWLDPPILFGANAFMSDMFQKIGGKAPELPQITSPYPQVSVEWLLGKELDVVFYLEEGGQPQRAGVEKLVRHWWPNRPPKVIALSSEKFSKATFTPLRHWAEIYPEQNFIAPEICGKL